MGQVYTISSGDLCDPYTFGGVLPTLEDDVIIEGPCTMGEAEDTPYHYLPSWATSFNERCAYFEAKSLTLRLGGQLVLNAYTEYNGMGYYYLNIAEDIRNETAFANFGEGAIQITPGGMYYPIVAIEVGGKIHTTAVGHCISQILYEDLDQVGYYFADLRFKRKTVGSLFEGDRTHVALADSAGFTIIQGDITGGVTTWPSGNNVQIMCYNCAVASPADGLGSIYIRSDGSGGGLCDTAIVLGEGCTLPGATTNVGPIIAELNGSNEACGLVNLTIGEMASDKPSILMDNCLGLWKLNFTLSQMMFGNITINGLTSYGGGALHTFLAPDATSYMNYSGITLLVDTVAIQMHPSQTTITFSTVTQSGTPSVLEFTGKHVWFTSGAIWTDVNLTSCTLYGNTAFYGATTITGGGGSSFNPILTLGGGTFDGVQAALITVSRCVLTVIDCTCIYLYVQGTATENQGVILQGSTAISETLYLFQGLTSTSNTLTTEDTVHIKTLTAYGAVISLGGSTVITGAMSMPTGGTLSIGSGVTGPATLTTVGVAITNSREATVTGLTLLQGSWVNTFLTPHSVSGVFDAAQFVGRMSGGTITQAYASTQRGIGFAYSHATDPVLTGGTIAGAAFIPTGDADPLVQSDNAITLTGKLYAFGPLTITKGAGALTLSGVTEVNLNGQSNGHTPSIAVVGIPTAPLNPYGLITGPVTPNANAIVYGNTVQGTVGTRIVPPANKVRVGTAVGTGIGTMPLTSVSLIHVGGVKHDC